MLVLSRRCEEKIVFPELGIALQVLQIKPHQIKLGIDAPESVTILRGELSHVPPLSARPSNQDATLKDLASSLRSLEQQWLLGQSEEALATITRMKEAVSKLRSGKGPQKPDILDEDEIEADESWRAFWNAPPIRKQI